MTTTDINGDISGGNVNIGGKQIVKGDIVIQNSRPKVLRMCPSPPSEPEKFGGRETQLGQIMERLRSGENTAITALHGTGGIGKTTLAKVVARRLYNEKTFCAVLWADVTRNPNPVNILSSWVVSYADSSFEVNAFNGNEPQIAAVSKHHLESVISEQCKACNPPRVLVVLDDVWDNGLSAARLILKGCPEHSTILITTRSENVAIDLNAGAEPLAYLTPDESVEMLKTYLQGFQDTSLRRLGIALGGHTLALELAARRVKKEQIPGETSENRLKRIVKDYEIGIPSASPFAQLKLEQGEQKEDNLSRSLYHSYESLSPELQKRFRAMGILPYNSLCPPDVLAAIWNTSIENTYEDANQLRVLSLIEIESSAYRQHPLLRTYARALLIEEQESVNTFNNYANHLISIAKKFNELELEEWYQLDQYIPHIHFVGDSLAQLSLVRNPEPNNVVLAGEFSWETMIYLHNRPENLFAGQQESRFPDRIKWLEMGAQAWRIAKNKQREASAISNMGLLWSNLGNQNKALEYYKHALALKHQVSDQNGEAATLANIGGVWNELGNYNKAIQFYTKALHKFTSIGNTKGKAQLLGNIGQAWSSLGKKEKAIGFFNRALQLIENIHDLRLKALTLNNLGLVLLELGNHEEALQYFHQSLSLSRQTRHLNDQAGSLNNIGMVMYNLEKYESALTYYLESLTLKRSIGDRSGEAIACYNISTSSKQIGRLDDAIEYLELYIKICEEIQYPISESDRVLLQEFIANRDTHF